MGKHQFRLALWKVRHTLEGPSGLKGQTVICRHCLRWFRSVSLTHILLSFRLREQPSWWAYLGKHQFELYFVKSRHPGGIPEWKPRTNWQICRHLPSMVRIRLLTIFFFSYRVKRTTWLMGLWENIKIWALWKVRHTLEEGSRVAKGQTVICRHCLRGSNPSPSHHILLTSFELREQPDWWAYGRKHQFGLTLWKVRHPMEDSQWPKGAEPKSAGTAFVVRIRLPPPYSASFLIGKSKTNSLMSWLFHFWLIGFWLVDFVLLIYHLLWTIGVTLSRIIIYSIHTSQNHSLVLVSLWYF